MKIFDTYIRHALTFLLTFGTILLGWNLIDPDSVEAVNKAGNDLFIPLVAFIGAVVSAIARKGLKLLGQKFPVLSGVSEDGKASGGSGLLPLAFFFLCAGCLFLPSCSGEYPLTGSISYRDPNSGAKGGLVFEPGKAPRASVRIPVYDEFGNIIGVGELSGPLAREIEVTK